MSSHVAGELNDEPLAQEIRLLADVILAVASAPRHLTDDEVDLILDRHRAAHEHR